MAYAEIGKTLGFSTSTIHHTIKRVRERASLKDAKRTGQPKKIPKKIVQEMKIQLMRGHLATASDVQVWLSEEEKIRVSTKCIRETLTREGFFPYHRVKKPFLSRRQRSARVRRNAASGPRWMNLCGGPWSSQTKRA